MQGSRARVMQAFDHKANDRTPLFEIFQKFHPIHWEICGRNIATDQARFWDALADGLTADEFNREYAEAFFKINRFFELDLVHTPLCMNDPMPRPVKTGRTSWTLDGVGYVLNEKTKLVVLENPAAADSYSNKITEDELRRQIEEYDGTFPQSMEREPQTFRLLKEKAAAAGIEWVYMAELGAGTGVAFWPPFQLMWLISDPELVHGWMRMKKERAFYITRKWCEFGCEVVAMGGDVSSDKGPMLSPAHYREFVLPVIQEHVNVIHASGAKAVYTSDGNHWAIADQMFFESGTDGYKEVDKAASMTWPKLIEKGIAEKVCIVGNLDARHTLCLAAPADVKKEVRECLDYGRQTPGGHILHASHSVHEDVRVENYLAAVAAYREYFGLAPLSL